jgi:hypothetical protein
VKLVEDGSDTILTYTVNAQVGGKLAQIGARLVDSTAKKYATDFFDKFVVIAKERDSSATDAPVAPSDAAPEEPAQAATSGTAEMHQPEEEQPPRPAPQKPETVDRDAIKADAKRAAVDAVHKQTAKRWGLTPMQWIMILVLIMLGLSLVFGNDAQMPGTGN